MILWSVYTSTCLLTLKMGQIWKPTGPILRTGRQFSSLQGPAQRLPLFVFTRSNLLAATFTLLCHGRRKSVRQYWTYALGPQSKPWEQLLWWHTPSQMNLSCVWTSSFLFVSVVWIWWKAASVTPPPKKQHFSLRSMSQDVFVMLPGITWACLFVFFLFRRSFKVVTQ